MEVCRACLSNDKNIISLTESFIKGYNLLTNIDIKPLDGMPQRACETCVNSVNYFIDFREQCIQAETSLREQFLKNIKSEPDEVESSEKNIKSPPKQVSLVKKPRGRPRKVVIASETEQLNCGSQRINKTIVSEEKKIVNSSLKNSSSEELSFSVTVTQLDQNVDLDLIKEEYQYEYLELFDEDLESRLEGLANVPNTNIPQILPAECIPNVRKPPRQKKPPKKLKTAKDLVVNETNFPCGLCEKKFESEQFVFNHLEEHRSDSKCETCEATFTEWQVLLAHRIKHVPSKYHRCHLCPKRLLSVETLEYHYLSKHSNKDVEDIKIQCKLCMKSFSTPITLKNHVATVHSAKKYICDFCSKIYGMETHLLQHSNIKKYKCDTCGDSFKQSSSLKAHIWRRHTATRVYCPCCHRVYPDKEALQKHVCPQTERVCPVCGKRFPRADRLKGHMASHAEGGKYKCAECPAEFRSRDALVAHSDRHRGRRAHACDTCPKRFFSAGLLARHKRIHTGVRPYVCKECGKAFNSSYNLKIHMKVHGQYLVVHRNKNPDGEDACQP